MPAPRFIMIQADSDFIKKQRAPDEDEFEGRSFEMLTDNKPLLYALKPASTRTRRRDAMSQAQVMDPDMDQVARDTSLNLAVLPITRSQNTTLREVV